MSESALMPAGGAAAQSGSQLAAARRDCNLSIADVAHHLKLSPAQIEAMEAGAFDRLPGAVFVRGFIRNYARLVKLDPVPLVASAERVLAVADPSLSPAQPSPDIPFPREGRRRWRRYAIGAALILVALAAFEFYASRPDNRAETASRPLGLARMQSATPPVVDPPPSAAVDASLVAVPAPGSAASDAATRSVKVAESRAGEYRVKLVFERESWVEIRDRNGRKLLSRINPAGTLQSVSGVAPLTLVIGNAAGVRLTHNDKPVDLVPHTNVGVARLTLE